MARGFGTRWIDIEDYIKIYKKAIKNAKPLEQIFRDFAQISIYIEIRGDTENYPSIDEIKDKYERKKLEEYLKKYNLSLEKADYFGEKVLILRRAISTAQQLLDAIKHRKEYDGKWKFRIIFKEKKRDAFDIPFLPKI